MLTSIKTWIFKIFKFWILDSIYLKIIDLVKKSTYLSFLPERVKGRLAKCTHWTEKVQEMHPWTVLPDYTPERGTHTWRPPPRPAVPGGTTEL